MPEPTRKFIEGPGYQAALTPPQVVRGEVCDAIIIGLPRSPVEVSIIFINSWIYALSSAAVKSRNEIKVTKKSVR